MPRWEATPPAVDTDGKSFAVLSFGREGRETAERWISGIGDISDVGDIGTAGPCWARHAERADEELLAALREQLRTALVGWRLMLAGPEAEVLPARSEALMHGAVPAEIRVHVTSARRKRVHCPHCQQVTATDRAVDESVRCGGCGRELAIYHHVSRRTGTYLGFMADAEAI
nr:dimethylamine monooxygenase subunit DmmA family protein [Streptomyces sp. 846.5]